MDLTALRDVIAGTHISGTTTTYELRERLHEVESDAGRLGRHIEHDIRSVAFAVDAGLATLMDLTPRPKKWDRLSAILNQGGLGSCTGNAMCGWLGCSPHVTAADAALQYDEAYAVKLYELATTLDQVPGAYPPDDTGSSGLAVAKAAKQLDQISAYHHALTTRGLLRALQLQPVIIGITWYSSFDRPGADGTISLTSDAYVRGGHEVLVRGWDGENLLADNSWGTGWGQNGSFKIPLSVWETLRRQGADVTVPIK